MNRLVILALGTLAAAPSSADDPKPAAAARTSGPALIRSAKSGPWSSADTWDRGKVPAMGARVQVRAGHTVRYDVKSDAAIRSVHVAGTLTFARDRDTALTVGLIKIQPGDDASEDGFSCDAHVGTPDPNKPRPALEVGTPNDPIPTGRTAVIRLALVEGLNQETCPAIICCGGRLDLHGAPLARTWVKLGATADKGATEVRLAEPAAGWRVGDRVIVTATGGWERLNRHRMELRPRPGREPIGQTEERVITAIAGDRLTLDRALTFRHAGAGEYRAEVANLSRNVVVESADPKGARGHTMYHKHSAGSIGYAEFRHLGKERALGKYPIHFHLCGDTMRGSSVVGASVWDSHNRWVVIHGTQYLIVRDCVGYQSVGHGYFLEDGTEVFNVLDRNLAVQAFMGKPLPEQALPLDRNDGAGFWWANNLNTFTRNAAAECDRWGFLFEIAPARGADVLRPLLQPDGTSERCDIRTLPFVRFEDNEAHDHLDGVSLGGKLGGFGEVVPGDPLLLRNTRIWNSNWAFTPFTRYAVDNLDIADCRYGLFRPAYDAEVRPLEPRDGRRDDADWGRISIRRTGLPIHLPTNIQLSIMGPFDLTEFAGDCRPPTTVITHARHADGKLIVRGTTADNESVRRVTVNGKEARSLAADFAEWEVAIDPPAGGKLTARAADRAGNEEPRPHTAVFRGGLLQSVGAQTEPVKREERPATARPGGDAKGLDGLWRVESQRRAGRATERPPGMTAEVSGESILFYPGGKASAGGGKAGPWRQGGIPLAYRPGKAGGVGEVEFDRKLSVNLGICKVEGDTLTICVGPAQVSPRYDPKAKLDEKGRPTRFSPEAGTLIVLKRAAP